jgi:PAS domain S-box-containing protein
MKLKTEKKLKLQLIGLVAVMSIIILISGHFYFRSQKHETKMEKYNELSAIAQLKTNQLTQWYKERLSEANFFSGSSPYIQYAKNILEKKTDDEILLRDALKRIMTDKRYENIYMLNENGQLLFSVVPDFIFEDTTTIAYSKKSFRTGEVLIRDFYFCNIHQKVHYQIIAPIADVNKQIIATLVFNINPYDYLYPLIQMWPTPSKTAETVLVRQKGDSVWILNDLRKIPNSVLQIGFPLSQTEKPAVRAALGQKGFFEGTDYMGAKVIADIKDVPNTPWHLIVKMDQAEIYAELNKRAILILIIDLLSIFFIGTAVVLLYHNRQKNIYRELLISSSALHQSEKEFGATLYSIGDGVITTDNEGLVKHLNPVAEKLTGWNEQEAIGKNIEEVFHIINEETHKEVENPVDKVLREGKTVGLANHTLLISKDGRETPISDSGAPIKDDQGNLVGVVMVFSDQTEERKQKKALRESEEKYRTLISKMQLALAVHEIITDKEGNPVDYLFLDVNESFEKLTGLKREEIIGKTVLEVLPNTEKAWIEKYGKVALTGEPDSFENYSQELGKYYNVLAYRNRINEFAVIFDDITVRKQMEEQRKQDEIVQQVLYEIAKASMSSKSLEELLCVVRIELGKLLDTTNFYVAIYRPETDTLRKIIFVNEKFDMEEWGVGKSLSGQLIKSGKTILLKGDDIVRFAKANGIERSNDILAKCWLGVPLIDEQKAIGVVVVQNYHDANAYDEKSARLLEIIAHQLIIVIQRTKMIQDLITAKEKAEESDRLQSAFLANMSHEIRTPMNGILGFLSLLNEPDLEEKNKKEYIEIVNKSGQRLLDTINNIIEISKIEAGESKVIYTEVNITEVMQFHYDFFKLQANAKGLKLHISEQITDKPALVLTDRSKLDSILTNLIKNAIKFTKKGSIELGNYIENDLLVFYIKDTGPGISTDRINAIFERFVQADQDINRPYEGSGLGLSITKAYVNALGGKIHVQSEVGKGSTFIFSIPYKIATGQTVLPGSKVITPGIQTKGMTILVAEDDEASYQLLKTILTKEDIALIHTTNGQDTIKVLLDNPEISLILMDIKMPEMDGLETTRQIRKLNKSIPIIAQTAYALLDDERKAKEAGCNDYISKPVKQRELIDMIEKYTTGRNDPI